MRPKTQAVEVRLAAFLLVGLMVYMPVSPAFAQEILVSESVSPEAIVPAPVPAPVHDEARIVNERPEPESMDNKIHRPEEPSSPTSDESEPIVPPAPEHQPPSRDGGISIESSTPPAPPYTSVQPVPTSYQVRPEVDQSTGALTYRYPFTLPPGRNGMTPELSLTYNSQDRRDGSPVGYGWNLSLPSIERQNITGIQNFFTQEHFTSSLSGELVRIAAGSGTNNFSARNEDGSFTRYTFANNAWTVTTKNGTRYTFGTDDASRLFDIDNDPTASKTAKWLLNRIEDANGNRINFSYVRDSNQLYLDTITYTDTASGTGPFLVTFIRELRPEDDHHISYASGFRTETKYRISEIQARISGQLTGKYALSYAPSTANNRTLLTSITQTGYDSAGTATTLPPTSFLYTSSSMSFTSDGPNPFSTVAPLHNSSLRFGYMIVDINGDGYADLVRSHKKSIGTPPINTYDRRVWINDHAGSLIESMTWTGTTTLGIICIEDDSFNCKAGDGVVILDKNGDMLPDYYRADGNSSSLAINIGTGWAEPTSQGNAYSLIPTYDYRPLAAAYDGANPPYVIEPSEPNGISDAFGTGSNRGNRVSDVNHDGLPDVVRSIGLSIPFDVINGLDEVVYFSTSTVNGVTKFAQSNWLFLNGTSTGENAPASKAIFEYKKPKAGSFADFNGDDLPDVVIDGNKIYRHTGNTWVYDHTITLTGDIEETQLADFNGDGMLDLVVSDACGTPVGACNVRVLYNTAQAFPDTLKTITLPAGGTITAAYKGSGTYKDASGNLLNPTLPMSIQTVSSITETDPVTGVSGTTSYEYAGGKYFFAGLTNRRLAGFSRVTTTNPDGSKHSTYFNVTEDGKLGKNERSETLDVSGNPINRTLTTWNKTSLSAVSEPRFLTVPQATVSLDFGAGGAYRAKAQQFTYDTAGGALLQTTDFGEVTVADSLVPSFTDLGTDARTTAYTYATNSNGLELPATQTLTDVAGTIVAKTRTYYDALPLGQVNTGNQTKSEQLIDVAAGTYAATQRTYTATGLVATETDPLNHTTQFTYDSFGLYPATVTNALNQATAYTYDYSNGKPITVTDANGGLHKTVFDGLDRVIEQWQPHPVTGVLTLTHTASYTDQPSQIGVHEQTIMSGMPVTSTNTGTIGLEDSLNQYLSTADTAPLSITGDMTIEMWVKPESQVTNGNDFVLASKLGTAGNRSYDFNYHDNAGTPQLRFITSANGTATTYVAINQTLSIGTWTHVAVVYTASSGSVEFFVNGSSVGTGNGLTTSLYDSTGDIGIGARPMPVPEAFFDGLIDDVRVWSMTRTGTQINTFKSVELVDNNINLRGYWKLNNSLTDSTTNGATLTANGNIPFSADVPFGATSDINITPDTHTYFDGFGRPVQQRTLAEGTYTVVDTHYDSQGRVESVTLPYESAGSARTSISTSPLIATTYQYDGASRVVHIADAIGATLTVYDRWDSTVTDPNGHFKKFGRDASDRLTRVEEFMSASAAPYVTAYDYDALGNLKNITDADGNIRAFTYDARGARLTAQDLHAPGDATFGTYTFAYDPAGNLTQKVTPKGDTINYTYDALNRQLTEDFTGASGTEVTYTYDTCTHGIGRQCSQSKSGFSKSLTYDLAGNVATETSTIGSAQYTTSYTYDQVGTVKSVRHPDGSTTLYTFNEGGKTETVSWQSAIGAPETLIVSSIDYAPHGAPAKVVRSNGLEEMFTYDPTAKYRLLEHVVGPPGSAGSSGSSNTHAIDLEHDSSQYLSAPDSASLSIIGNLTLEAWVKLESEASNGSAYTIAGKWDGGFSGSATGRSYVFRYSKPEGGGTGVLNLSISADGNSWSLVSKAYALQVGQWHHLAVAYTASAGQAEFFVNGISIGTASGLPTSIHNNTSVFGIGAHDIGTTPDDIFDGLIDDVRVWDIARSGSQISATMSDQFAGTEIGLRAYWKLNNSLADLTPTGNTLTNNGSALFTTDVPFSGSGGSAPTTYALSRYQYTYDPVGNVLSTIESAQDATTTSSYTYDWLDRLTQASASKQTSTSTTQTVSDYTYGPTGNLLSSPAGSYSYSGSGYANPHAATSVGSINLTYDNNGNVITRSDNKTHAFDYNNRLAMVSLTNNGRRVGVYSYDPAGTRVAIVANGITTAFPTAQFSTNGTTTTISLEVGGMPLATIDRTATTTEVYATHTDHLRSSRLSTNSAGAITESTDYTPFGAVSTHTQSGNFTERRKYTGHELDTATNYTYAKARYLETNVGRFLSQDPAFIALGDHQAIGEKTGRSLEEVLIDPQTLNSYSYVKNNPIRFVDPTGEYLESALDVGFIAYDLHAIATGGFTFTNAVSLAGDIAGLLLPGITGVGPGVRAISHADDVVKGVKAVGEIAVEGAAHGGDIVNAGSKLVGEGSSILKQASDAAFKAAEKADTFTLKGKHLYGDSGTWSKFAEGIDPNAVLKEALASPGALFSPNYKPGTFTVISDLGSKIGSKGQTNVKAIVDFSGEVITWYPIK